MARILLVEDDTFLASIISRELSSAGYAMDLASEGEAAFQQIKENAPNLILLDLLMPHMDGFQVLEKIKADPATSAIPVIVLSNLGDEKDIERAKKLGALDYYVKVEFSPQSIREKVQATLDGKPADAAAQPQN